MTVEDIIKYYKNGYRFEEETGMSRMTYHNWKNKGYIPIFTQKRIELLTGGKLKADIGYKNVRE